MPEEPEKPVDPLDDLHRALTEAEAPTHDEDGAPLPLRGRVFALYLMLLNERHRVSDLKKQLEKERAWVEARIERERLTALLTARKVPR